MMQHHPWLRAPPKSQCFSCPLIHFTALLQLYTASSCKRAVTWIKGRTKNPVILQSPPNPSSKSSTSRGFDSINEAYTSNTSLFFLVCRPITAYKSYPIGSMYGIFDYMYSIFMVLMQVNIPVPWILLRYKP